MTIQVEYCMYVDVFIRLMETKKYTTVFFYHFRENLDLLVNYLTFFSLRFHNVVFKD